MSGSDTTSRWGPFGSLEEALKTYRVGAGEILYDLSFRRPVMIVFLRHGGCTFCREALGDLASVRDRIAGTGAELVVVQMGTPREGQDLARRFGLLETQVISDPSRRLYRAFELGRGTLRQIFGLRVWLRFLQVGVLRRFGAGLPKGKDERQMPGVFLLRNGEIVREFRHDTIADRPDYVALASLATTHAEAPLDRLGGSKESRDGRADGAAGSELEVRVSRDL